MTGELPTLHFGVLGTGAIGPQVIRLLVEQGEEFATQSGVRMHVGAVLVRILNASCNTQIVPELLTVDPAEAINRMDIVIKLIGGIELTRTHVLYALSAGINVVTDNRAPLAVHGPELYVTADASNADLYYEATVAGAVPVAYGLRESLAGNRIMRVIGIMNGTTNFVLDAVATRNFSYETALKQT